MSALTADTACSIVGTAFVISKYSSNQTAAFWKGSLVYIDTAGGVQTTFAAGDRFLGISPKYQKVAVGTEVEVLVMRVVRLPLGTNIAVADEGDMLVNDRPRR